MSLPDLTAMSPTDLAALRDAVEAEVQRRRTLTETAHTVARANADYLTACGIEPGQEWRPPVGALGAYPLGWVVIHDGTRWESLIEANVTKPGDPTDPQAYRWWENLDEQPVEGEWDGNGRTYAVGEEVIHGGAVYRCLQAHTSQPGWSPDVVPALWEPVSP